MTKLQMMYMKEEGGYVKNIHEAYEINRGNLEKLGMLDKHSTLCKKPGVVFFSTTYEMFIVRNNKRYYYIPVKDELKSIWNKWDYDPCHCN